MANIAKAIKLLALRADWNAKYKTWDIIPEGEAEEAIKTAAEEMRDKAFLEFEKESNKAENKTARNIVEAEFWRLRGGENYVFCVSSDEY